MKTVTKIVIKLKERAIAMESLLLILSFVLETALLLVVKQVYS